MSTGKVLILLLQAGGRGGAAAGRLTAWRGHPAWYGNAAQPEADINELFMPCRYSKPGRDGHALPPEAGLGPGFVLASPADGALKT